MAEITLKITADDSELMAQMMQIHTSIEDIDESAASLGDSLDESFSEGADASRKLNKQLDKTEKTFKKTTRAIDKTGKQMDKTGKKTKSLTAKLRGAQKSIGLMKFAAGGMFVGALSQMGAMAEGLQKFAGLLSPAIALQGRLRDASAGVASGFIEQKINLQSLIVTASAENTNTKQAVKARKAIIDQYGDLLTGEQKRAVALGNTAGASKALTEVLIKQFAVQAQEQQLVKMFEELAAAEVKSLQIDERKSSSLGKLADNVNRVTNAMLTLGASEVLVDGQDLTITGIDESMNEANKRSLINQAKNSDKIREGMEKSLKEVSGVIETIFGKSSDLTKKTVDDVIDGFTSSAAAGTSILEGSLADLQRWLADVNRGMQEGVKAGDKEGLGPLVAQAKDLEKQIEMAQLAIKELRGEADETAEQRATRLKRQAELIIELTSDLEKKTVDQLRAAAKVQADDINKTVKDAKLRNELLILNNNQLQTDILASTAKFEKEKTDKRQAAAQERLEQELTLSEAELRAMQTAQTDELLTRGATEEEATKIQKEQEIARQRLTLENEKKRLQLILQFSKGRTAIEIDETKATIAAINSELNSLGKEFAKEGEKKGLLEFLGIDISPEQLDAIKTVGAEVLGIIETNTQAQIDAANKSIDARDKEIDNLSAQLDRELEFRKAGLASNVEGIRENLSKEEALRKQALQERAAAQKTQFAIETATQGVNLITSATEIIKAFSAIPFVGVALGIAAVGAMFAGFVAARAKAFQSIKMAKGGMLEGQSHAKGGVPMSVDGQYTYEGERGEWVTNARDSAEHNKVLELINNGRFRGVDLMGIIKNGLYGGISKNGFDLRSSQRTQSENVQRGAVSSAIEKQTEILIERMDRMYSRPQIRPTDTGYLKPSIGSNGNISITKFNKK